jgi:hypothetical protein
MSKRLQVLLEEAELLEIQETARRNGMTVAEWVRRSLREARKEGPVRDTLRKLEVVRAAVRHEFPTANIEEMLEEIERGYVGGGSP